MAGRLPRPVGRRKEPVQSACPASYVDVKTSFADGIGTISLLESWEMVFRARGGERGRKVTQRLDRRSAAIMIGDARYRWTHEIPERKYEPGRVARGRRISLTFRRVLAPPDGGRAFSTVAEIGRSSV